MDLFSPVQVIDLTHSPEYIDLTHSPLFGEAIDLSNIEEEEESENEDATLYTEERSEDTTDRSSDTSYHTSQEEEYEFDVPTWYQELRHAERPTFWRGPQQPWMVINREGRRMRNEELETRNVRPRVDESWVLLQDDDTDDASEATTIDGEQWAASGDIANEGVDALLLLAGKKRKLPRLRDMMMELDEVRKQLFGYLRDDWDEERMTQLIRERLHDYDRDWQAYVSELLEDEYDMDEEIDDVDDYADEA